MTSAFLALSLALSSFGIFITLRHDIQYISGSGLRCWPLLRSQPHPAQQQHRAHTRSLFHLLSPLCLSDPVSSGCPPSPSSFQILPVWAPGVNPALSEVETGCLGSAVTSLPSYTLSPEELLRVTPTHAPGQHFSSVSNVQSSVLRSVCVEWQRQHVNPGSLAPGQSMFGSGSISPPWIRGRPPAGMVLPTRQCPSGDRWTLHTAAAEPHCVLCSTLPSPADSLHLTPALPWFPHLCKRPLPSSRCSGPERGSRG